LVSHTEGRTQIEGVKNKMPRGIFGPKREKVVGGWRRQHKKGLHNLYTSNIVRVITSRRMR
jgi:hypothetical protein